MCFGEGAFKDLDLSFKNVKASHGEASAPASLGFTQFGACSITKLNTASWMAERRRRGLTRALIDSDFLSGGVHFTITKHNSIDHVLHRTSHIQAISCARSSLKQGTSTTCVKYILQRSHNQHCMQQLCTSDI